MKQKKRKWLTGLMPLLFIPFFWNPIVAKGEGRTPEASDGYHGIHRETAVLEILDVLGERIGDQRLLDKARRKLLTLKDPELNLITSLSEQIKGEGQKPGVDIAFLLITALLILS